MYLFSCGSRLPTFCEKRLSKTVTWFWTLTQEHNQVRLGARAVANQFCLEGFCESC